MQKEKVRYYMSVDLAQNGDGVGLAIHFTKMIKTQAHIYNRTGL